MDFSREAFQSFQLVPFAAASILIGLGFSHLKRFLPKIKPNTIRPAHSAPLRIAFPRKAF